MPTTRSCARWSTWSTRASSSPKTPRSPPRSTAVAGGRPVLTRADVLPGSLTPEELAADRTDEVDRRCAALRHEDVAKILFTSGSTGTPKGVVNTHGMLAANQQQMRQVWPFLAEEPPVLLDWLPWSHTFGGNHDVNMVLTNGGTLWIDDGRPAPALIERTVRNLADAQPTIYFNVPAGYAALLPHLERDPAAAQAFLSRLRLGFFAAAALPQQLWDRLSALAERDGSPMQMTTSWGLTESSPAATSAHFPITRSDSLGVPLPGVEIALVPVGEKLEVRLRGPNITPGYYRRPDLADAAFDEHGYFRTGDAVALADPDDPAAGLVFRGRIAEDFKLATGTFVSVGTLRPQLLSASHGLLTDAVICGENGDRVTALVLAAPRPRPPLRRRRRPRRRPARRPASHLGAPRRPGRRIVAAGRPDRRPARTARTRRGRDHRQGLRQPACGP